MKRIIAGTLSALRHLFFFPVMSKSFSVSALACQVELGCKKLQKLKQWKGPKFLDTNWLIVSSFIFKMHIYYSLGFSAEDVYTT